MSYRKTTNTTRVVVETTINDTDADEIHVHTSISPGRHNAVYADRGGYADKSRYRDVRNAYYSPTPKDRNGRDIRSGSFAKKVERTASTLAQTQEKMEHSRFSENRSRGAEKSLQDKYMSPSPNRRSVKAGSDIKLDKSRTKYYNPDRDHLYNQRESHLPPEERAIYESPLKKFDHSVHNLYTDRRIEGEQMKIGSRSSTRMEDPYTRKRKVDRLIREVREEEHHDSR